MHRRIPCECGKWKDSVHAVHDGRIVIDRLAASGNGYCAQKSKQFDPCNGVADVYPPGGTCSIVVV